MRHKTTDLLIFDLGRVLVDFDFKRVIRGLKHYSTLSEKEIKHYFETTPLWDAFERGHVQPAEFFVQIQKDLHLKQLSFEVFAPLWNNIFTEKHDTVILLKELRKRYRLAMLSNVNAMHWEFIRGRHDFMKWFDYPVASYAVGHRKPDTEIYQIVLRKAGALPDRSVFIDDIESHIHAAKSVGIRAHQFHTADQLRKDLADLL